MTDCCETAAEQSVEACLEYAQLGFSRLSCRSWPRAARLACHRWCGDCEKIAAAVKDECSFSLQVLGNGPLQRKYCEATHEQFLKYRCQIGCKYNATNCTGDHGNPEGDYCMAECGNYKNCNCRHRKGTLLPDICDGQTILKGPKVNSTRNHSCDDTPDHCKNNVAEGAKCNKYRLCTPDMCQIKDVKCPPLDQCTLPGFCEKSEGVCFYSNVDEGTPCDDNVTWTVRDQCINGQCIGEVDNCKRYGVTCPSYSACLKDGVCHPKFGRCVYTPVMDGYPCDDGRPFTVEDGCKNGFCLGRAINLCVENGVNCSDLVPNECHQPGVCHPDTGKCSLPVPISNKMCNDGDPTTFNDTCIDGLCVGYMGSLYDQKFETLGSGQCFDRAGFQLPSYAGDVPDEPACEAICRGDRQCTAFSYAPPSCVVYGSIRTRPPVEATRPWAWQGGSVPPAVGVEISKTVKGQRESVCRKKDEFGDKVMPQASGKVSVSTVFAPNTLLLFFFLILLTFCFGPIWRCWRTCICGPDRDCCCRKRKTGLVTETRLVVASPRSESPPSPKKMKDLRFAGQAPQQQLADAPADDNRPALPDLPDLPEPLTPSEALAPLTLPPTPGVLPGTPSENSRDSPKKWQRPVGRRKPAQEEEKAPEIEDNVSHMAAMNLGASAGRNVGVTGFQLM